MLDFLMRAGVIYVHDQFDGLIPPSVGSIPGLSMRRDVFQPWSAWADVAGLAVGLAAVVVWLAW